ncbi:glutamate decarboxylase [Actinopolyspora halophila]|uniref:glutamate decarboxylase n=1 Tax=Actinopolyspora halophila TaxID=1850 RepID=UPI0004765B6D|nr:glutamate decarboxylase [Actinopolyspora halophila]
MNMSGRPAVSRPGTPASTQVPPGELPEHGREASAAADVLRKRLGGDTSPTMNLATFLATSYEPEAAQLFNEYLEYNLVDRDQYPAATEIEQQCVRILGELWSGDPKGVVGGATTGSSEAALLAGAALLRRWEHNSRSRRGNARPNLVFGSNAHVCWHKFCRHWNVEPRVAPVGEQALHLTPESATELCDENTIGVVGILGSTIDGSYEPIAEIAAALDELADSSGVDVPLHIDAASGGFIAPFLDPELVWDFRLPRVHSINTSGHKYGLVPPGLGWMLWRNRQARTGWLNFRTNYLGSTRTHHELTFSRSAAPVVVQYYNFVRLGFEGYRAAHARSREIATMLADALAETGPFRILGDGRQLPVVALRLRDHVQWKLHELSDYLGQLGWSVPVYALPPDMEDTDVLRVVIRDDMTRGEAESLLSNVRRFVTTP